MKELSFLAADEESLYFIPENIILEAAENEDGTTTLAIVDVINVKSHIDDVRKEISKRQRDRILWHTLSQPS
ncbi:MAG: hypothetical protein J5615_08075 [Fibrobacter sp.]|nr:hypothetical protein [Fibrobacter sp.]